MKGHQRTYGVCHSAKSILLVVRSKLQQVLTRFISIMQKALKSLWHFFFIYLAFSSPIIDKTRHERNNTKHFCREWVYEWKLAKWTYQPKQLTVTLGKFLPNYCDISVLLRWNASRKVTMSRLYGRTCNLWLYNQCQPAEMMPKHLYCSETPQQQAVNYSTLHTVMSSL